MSKYKIHINPSLPDPKKMEERKDFSKVFRTHQRMRSPWWVLKNVYKKPKVKRIAFFVLIVLLTLYFTSDYFKQEAEKVKKESVE